MPPWENTPIQTFICAICQVEFTAKRKSARFCSEKCREKNRPKRERDKEQERIRLKEWRSNKIASDPLYRQKENQKLQDRYRKLKDWINEYKTSHGCIDCGYNEYAVALDFDHIDGKTKNIANLKSIGAVIKEIERHGCVIRCSNCHRVKSWKTKSWIKDQ